MKTLLAALSFVLLATGLHARVDLLLVPPLDAVSGQPGGEFRLHINNPTVHDTAAHFPTDILAAYATSTGNGRVRLELADPGDVLRTVPAMSRRTIVLRLVEAIPGASGFVSLRLTNPPTNAIMFELAPAGSTPPAPAGGPSVAPVRTTNPSKRDIDLTSDLEVMRRHLTTYDPIYFALGWRERLNARFQYSFKYRVFDRGPSDEPWPRQLARDLYVAYTQTSIWDLETFSKPFYDSSYKPTVFLLHEFDPMPASRWRFSLQSGAQHESNGKGGGSAPVVPQSGLLSSQTALRHPSDSRSMNTLYFAPTVRWVNDADFFIEARTRAILYLQIRENPDIRQYRGSVELTLRGGYDRGFQVAVNARGNITGHGGVELNLTWPAIRTPLLQLILPASMGGYAQIQYYNGYGESLLDYDVRRKDQLRFGMTVVR